MFDDKNIFTESAGILAKQLEKARKNIVDNHVTVFRRAWGN